MFRITDHSYGDGESGTDGLGEQRSDMQWYVDEHRVEQPEWGSRDTIFLDGSTEQCIRSQCGRSGSRTDSTGADGVEQCGRNGDLYDYADSHRMFRDTGDSDGYSKCDSGCIGGTGGSDDLQWIIDKHIVDEPEWSSGDDV